MTKTNVDPFQSETGEFITANKEMSKELNLYFIHVFLVPEVLRETCFSEELKEISISREIVLRN